VYVVKGDTERGIADYGEWIKLAPKNDLAYLFRGIAHLYGGSPPKAQADFKQGATVNPKSAYLAIWLDLAGRRGGQASTLAQTIKQVDMKAWPAPVVKLLLGEMKLDDVRAAAADKDEATNRNQLCEVNFYGAEWAQLQRQKDEAVRLYRAAAKDCPTDFVEWSGAHAALRVLGAKP
jgi:lipoprotein NlpI